MNPERDVRIEPWVQLSPGAVVRIKDGSRKGAVGIVRRKLDTEGNRSISGMCRYEVVLPGRSSEPGELVMDYCRFELDRVRRKRGGKRVGKVPVKAKVPQAEGGAP